MQLYYLPGACSLAPHIFFEWLKLPYELVKADTKDPGYKLINPMLSVPALVTEKLGALTQVGADPALSGDPARRRRLRTEAG